MRNLWNSVDSWIHSEAVLTPPELTTSTGRERKQDYLFAQFIHLPFFPQRGPQGGVHVPHRDP